jgi:hypothetical protein
MQGQLHLCIWLFWLRARRSGVCTLIVKPDFKWFVAFSINVQSALGLLYLVVLGDVADVSALHAISILRVRRWRHRQSHSLGATTQEGN